MRKNLIKATATAIIASSVTGCGLFANAPEHSMPEQTDVSGVSGYVTDASNETDDAQHSEHPDEPAKAEEDAQAEKPVQVPNAAVRETAAAAPAAAGVTAQNYEQYPGGKQMAYLFPAVNVVKDEKKEDTSTSDRTPELSPYQKELNRLNGEIEKAAAQLVAAKTAYAKANAEYQEAQAELRKASGLVVTDENALEMAKAYTGSRKAALRLAQEKLTAAEEEYNDVILQTRADYNLAEAAAARELNEKKQTALGIYNQAVSDAEAEFNIAVGIAEDTYNGEMEAASMVRDSKTAESNRKYDAAVKAAEERYDAAVKEARVIQEKAIAKAQETYDRNLADCEAAYAAAIEEAEHDPDYLAAVQALNDATLTQINAVNSKVEAEAALQTAKDELALAREEKADRDAEVFIALDAKNAAEADLEHAEKMLAASREALEIANGNDATAKRNVQDAERAVKEATDRKTEAENELAVANQALELAQGRIDAAEAEVETARQGLEAANETVAKGVLGFYEYRLAQGDRDAQAAIDILNYASSEALQEEKRTEIGKTDDATSLENVRKVFDYIREGNELAENDPNISTNGFGVTYRLMAIAEMNANYASYTHNHPARDKDYNLEYAVSENLAWGFGDAGTASSPYQGWYYDEKPFYEQVANNPADTAAYYASGHYRNLLSNSQGNRYTGFGISTESGRTVTGANRSATFAQEFSWAKAGDVTYSVDDYETMYLAYYNAVMDGVKKAQSVLDEKTEILADLNSRGGLTPEEKQKINEAAAEVAKAEEVLAASNTILAGANLDAEEKAKELVTAKADVQEKERAVAQESADYQYTVSELAKAEDAANEAGEIVLARKGAVDAAEAGVKKAAEELQSADEALEEADSRMEEKKQWVIAETADEKQAADDARNDDIVERTKEEQKQIFDASTADALAEKEEAAGKAESERDDELNAVTAEFDDASADASKKLADANAEAAETKAAAESKAADEKQASDANAQNAYDQKVAEASEIKAQADAESQEKLTAVQVEEQLAAEEYNSAVVIESSVESTAEAVEKSDVAVESAEKNLAKTEEDKDRFENPEKYQEQEAHAEEPVVLAASGFSWSGFIGNRLGTMKIISDEGWFKRFG